jgi:hypothetical protein
MVTFNVSTVGSLRYDSYTFRPTATSCVTVTVTSTSLEPVLYFSPFNPDTISNNFFSYSGWSGSTQTFSFTATAGQTYVLVINEISTGNGVGTSYSVTLSGVIVGGWVTGNTTVCQGTNSSVLHLIDTSDPVVRWESSTNGGTSWSPITDTSRNYTATDLTQTTQFRAITHTVYGHDTAAFPATITVNPAPSVTLAPFNDVCYYSGTSRITGGQPLGGSYSGSGVGLSANNQTVCIYSHHSNCSFTANICNDTYDTITGTKTSSPVTISNADTITSIQFKLYYLSCNGTGQVFTFFLNGDSIGSYTNTDGGCSTCNPATYPVTVTLSGANLNKYWIFGGANILAITNNARVSLAGYTATVNYSSFVFNPIAAGAGTHNITYSYTNLTGCTGTPVTKTIKVILPVLSSVPADVRVCPGDTINTGVFSGTPAGVTFSWINNNTAIGLPASDSGNIASYNAPGNSTPADVVGNIGLMPHYSGCTGDTGYFKIAIKPYPAAVASPSSQSICMGSAIDSIVLSTSNNLAGTTFSWTRDHNIQVTGIDSSGNGNIKGTLTKITSDSVTVTFTIASSDTNGCSGTPIAALVKLYPATVGGSVTGGDMICDNSPSGLLTLSGFYGSIVKWQSSVSPFTDWTDIANTDSTYTSGNLTETTKFRAVVQSGNCAVLNSDSTTVTDDTIKPTINCPANQIENPDAGVFTYTVKGTEFDPSASDNCSVASLTHDYDGGGSSLAGKLFPADTTLVTWTATDSHGNSSACSFDVIVKRALWLSASTLGIGAADKSTATFDITSNTGWSVGSSETWLSPNTASGSGNTTVTLTASANTTSVTRDATVTVSGTGVSDKTVDVTQAAGSTSVGVTTASKILVYPSPAYDVLFIDGLTSPSVISVYNIIGNVIAIKQPIGNRLDISNLSPGVYILKIENKNNITTERFIKK